MAFSVDPYVIAEAGSNHGGSLDQALALVDLAAEAGADCVKFQFIFPETLYLPVLLTGDKTRESPVFIRRKREQLSDHEWSAVWAHAKARSIDASASVFCSRGLALLAKLGAPFVKISSSDLTNIDLILEAGSAFNHVILSTGMASLPEVLTSVKSFKSTYPKSKLSLMHCVSSYPCELAEANIARVKLFSEVFPGHSIGYSDHTLGVESGLLASAQGASFFEKHFTQNRELPGFDHAHATDYDGLREYVDLLSTARKMLSQDPLYTNALESETALRARRAVYAARDLEVGHVIKAEDLLYVRPSSASSVLPSQLIGKQLGERVRRFSALGFTGVGEAVTLAAQAESYWESEMSEKGMFLYSDERPE